MGLWICTGCTAAYSVDAPACPQCGSTQYLELGATEAADQALAADTPGEAQPQSGADESDQNASAGSQGKPAAKRKTS